ncbi:bifunctional diguanylate cyclase/phosphodiesterase [Pseudoalteromonas sp. G4]|uniref:bifunctional diguanylate cyclase/phosphodiesterase n=1 Tax=Pseudoalteromonas sp. G4 TaxID=2992761 RepID=UPI00237EAF21|nr:diguanylate cyclase [Pseudoalteromonas sp. G4]MDE3271493.1 diguanylate cyclase [Pseudoalteromonas sp. G4]
MEDAPTYSASQRRKIKRLTSLVKRYQTSLQTQNALLQLSEQASKVSELTLLYPAIQQILENSLPCRNFYVVLFNPVIGELELTYFVDEVDGIHLPIQALQTGMLDNSLTGLVFKTGRTKLFNKEQIAECEIKGICRVMGTPCEYWLGVPIHHDGKVIGVMATQSYDINQPFDESQIALFETVAFYFSTAVERVKKRQYMAQQVEERTEQLRLEVARNQETIRKQNILYAISKLATKSLNNQDFFKRVHSIVNEEVFAKNLFIALYDRSENSITCPYAVDEMSSDYQPRTFSKGLTEFVINSGKTELFDQNRILNEVAKGNIELPAKFNNSPLPTSWIGVPLYHRQQVIGVLACQAFNGEYHYKLSDIELISFVSEQISNVVVKHLADNQLEQRVKEKTAELQQANIHLQLQIEERKKIERQLFHDAHHDNLTGLANRSLFISQLDKTLQRNKRDKSHCFAVMFIDLDNFKDINDTLGHHAGDKFLKSTANEFSTCIREHDLLARFGGDEFVILLTHLQHKDEAKQIAKRIIKIMNKPFCINEQCIKSGASIGIAYSNKAYASTDEIIRDADSAMYQAKKSGKGTIKLASSEHIPRNNLVSANEVNTGQLSFVKSNIISLEKETGVATYFNPHLTLESGAIIALNHLLQEQHPAIDYCDYLLNQVLPHVVKHDTVFLQLHTSILANEFEHFSQQLAKSRHDICWLINDSNLAELSTRQIENLQQLKKMGFKIGVIEVARQQIDLVKLTCIEFDYLLLDLSFCRKLINEKLAQQQLAALIALTQNTTCNIVATGPAIVNFQSTLKKLGVNLFLSPLTQETEQLSSVETKPKPHSKSAEQ